jgi:hypothetical protein
MTGSTAASVPSADTTVAFVSPIDQHCPIGGGVFSRGKTANFAMTSPATPQEANAAVGYKGLQYMQMNRLLREGTIGTNVSRNEIHEKNELMHSLIGKSTVKTSGVVYRGISGSARELDNLDWHGAIGSKITFKGFTSTSQNENFAKVEKGWTASDGLFFRIYLPKGAHALRYTDTHGQAADRDPEREVILPHNSTFHIHAVQTRPGGGKTVDLIMQR